MEPGLLASMAKVLPTLAQGLPAMHTMHRGPWWRWAHAVRPEGVGSDSRQVGDVSKDHLSRNEPQQSLRGVSMPRPAGT